MVEKHTAYAKYMRQRQQGLAPLAVNWEQVKDRHTHHQKATDMLRDVLRRFDAEVQHSVCNVAGAACLCVCVFVVCAIA